jgi:hypothetical protein
MKFLKRPLQNVPCVFELRIFNVGDMDVVMTEVSYGVSEYHVGEFGDTARTELVNACYTFHYVIHSVGSFAILNKRAVLGYEVKYTPFHLACYKLHHPPRQVHQFFYKMCRFTTTESYSLKLN